MTIRNSLMEAMRLSGDTDSVQRLSEQGLAVADEDTMSRAIHDVYCGIMADHEHPNEKDREQARAMIAALQTHAMAQSGS